MKDKKDKDINPFEERKPHRLVRRMLELADDSITYGLNYATYHSQENIPTKKEPHTRGCSHSFSNDNNFYMMTSNSSRYHSDTAYNSSYYDGKRMEDYYEPNRVKIPNIFRETTGDPRYISVPGNYKPVSTIYLKHFLNTPREETKEPKEILDRLCQFYTEYYKKENVVLRENVKPLWQQFYEYNLKNSGKQELIIPKVTVGQVSSNQREYKDYKEAIEKGEQIVLGIDKKANFFASMFIVIDQIVYFQKETYIYANIK